MATEGQPTPIPNLIIAHVNENLLLTHVRTVSDPKSLLDRNTIHGDPYLHNVKLFAAFKEPEYDPAKMTAALNELITALRSYEFKGSAMGSRIDRFWHGAGNLVPGVLFLHEPMGIRVETSTWSFKPNNEYARGVMAQAGMEEGQEHTKVEEKPMWRQVSTTILPSIPLANLAATNEEMSNIPKQEDRPFPVKNSLYAYHGVLSLGDLEKLKQDPTYVQEMADKALVGYRVPGITRRPGRIERIAQTFGFLPSQG
ncbi:MAG: hypothetical protein HYW45_00890 [Candidatus Daviesbacteria bacterium]|nr:MAG: hypothetical protein HYW45_00890 [Candidatus Daviesbacteria bacterium]